MRLGRRGWHRDPRVPVLLAVALMAELLVAGTTLVVRSLPAPVPAALPAPAPAPPVPAAARLVVRPEQPPALVLRQPLLPLGITRDGTLEVPDRAQDLGRWADGPLPGDVGPAVLVGHVDLDGRPGVFSRVSLLRTGDVVSVRRPDGRDVRFRVTRTARFAKKAFPTDLVYSGPARPALRLVTCGGRFDRLRGHYRDNVVVFAELA